MESDADDGGPPAVQREQAEGELQRLLADSRFHLSDRNRAFLRYLAEACFSGQSKGVKAYSVAIDVFGRPSNFDPNTDPIVRIEATRLRTSLEQYYEAFGHETSVRIEVPRGSYIAQFHKTAQSEQLAAAPEVSTSLEAAAQRPLEKGFRLQSLAIIFGALVVVIVGLFLVFQTSFEGSDATADVVGKPVVTLLRSDLTETSQATVALEENLMVALSRFESLRVRSETDLGPSRAIRRNGQGPAGEPVESQYEIALRYRLEKGVHSLRWRVIDTQSGEALATGNEISEAGKEAEADVLESLSNRIAVQLAADNGILGSLEMRKGYSPAATGNICVLRGERALNRMDMTGLLAVHGCLDATVAADGENSDALATLARVLVAQDEIAGRTENTTQATTYANRSMAIAPASPRSLIARMVAMYANGQSDAARSAGEAAIAFNPLDVENAATFALRLYLSGARQEALALLLPLPPTNLHSWDEDFLHALDDFMNHRHADAIAQLDGMVHEDVFASALRIASLLCMGQVDKAKLAFSAVDPRPEDFFQAVSNVMDARHVDAAIRKRLTDELAPLKDW